MKRKQGFTLIEVLIVLAIIGILFVLILPAVASTRERAHTATCINNMKQITMAALMYADDHDEAIPDVSVIGDYIDDESVYVCPRDTRSGVGASKPSYTAYKYTPASLLPSDINGLFSESILYIESDKAGMEQKDNILDSDVDFRHDNRTVVVFADGHMAVFSKEQYAALQGLGGPSRR